MTKGDLMADHARTQERIIVGLWPDQLSQLDELARLLDPDTPRPSRNHAIRMAIRGELERRKKNRKNPEKTP
jgi:metal-responsive CopG/Arc/MetJ family transcriptional regulator